MKRKRIFSTSMAFSALVLLAMTVSAQANENVHFGTIFIDDMNYDKEESRQQLNTLTDKSKQQRNLETLHPELKEKNQRLRDIKDAPEKNNAGKKISVVKNEELTKKVVYFIELRPMQNNSVRNLYPRSNTLNAPLARVEPGELLKVVDTAPDYIHKMRMDRDNQGVWKQVARTHENDPVNLYVYYDWKNFETLSPMENSIELDILVPRNQSSVPVYSKPGAWTGKDCDLDSTLCIDRIDQHTDVYLFDTTFVAVNDMRTRQNKLQLYYKIGYRLYNKEGKVRHKIGWVPSYMARRKITQIPKNFLGSSQHGFSGFETDEERIERLKKYYIFKDNMYSENRLTNRWLKSRPGEKFEIFDQTMAWDGILGFQYFTLSQTFNPETFSQYSVSTGVGMYVPLFVDLEVQGTFLLSVPFQHKPENSSDFDSAFLFRGDQWLMYTTPLGINRLPVKFGIGGYYITMFESSIDFGFKSFIGFQVKAMIESERFWFDVRYGPTGQDFSFKFSNREVGTSLGVRLDPAQAYDSWTLYLDYGSTSFTSEETGHITEYELFQLGLRKTF